MSLDPDARPAVQLAPLVHLLAGHQVDWVLTGSAVLAIYGGRLVPNDLDVTPALDAGNLERLGAALEAIEAVPAYQPRWPAGPTREQCLAWTPRPATESNLDHLFVTRLGMLDVPPRLCGTYAQLIDRATRVDIAGVPVMVCAVAEVLDRLRGRRRSKDQRRAGIYGQVERHANAGPDPDGVSWLLECLPAPVPVPPRRRSPAPGQAADGKT
jgi:hypothetical protein